jgi:tRNA pseudouridine55 synthase
MNHSGFKENGFLLVNKPKGVSSAGFLGKVKKKIGAKKIGHTGTLDPFASGLLILCVGSATKLSNEFLTGNKTYRGWAKLGQKTVSGDCTGEVTETSSLPTLVALQDNLESFIGEIEQVPPMHSAIKKNGVPLYKLAHKGKTVERKPRKVKVFDFKILSHVGSEQAIEEIEFEVSCSSGTYIRTLIEDWALASKSLGFVRELTRTSVRGFSLEGALSEDDFEEKSLDLLSTEAWVRVNDPRIDFLKKIEISEMEARLLRLGRPGPVPYIERVLKKNEDPFSSNVILTSENLPVAYLAWSERRLKLQRVFPA